MLDSSYDFWNKVRRRRCKTFITLSLIIYPKTLRPGHIKCLGSPRIWAQFLRHTLLHLPLDWLRINAIFLFPPYSVSNFLNSASVDRQSQDLVRTHDLTIPYLGMNVEDFKGASAGDICTPRCMVALFITSPTEAAQYLWIHKGIKNSMKRQKDMAWEDEPSGQQVSNMLPGKSQEMAPERMKRLGQSRNDTQLWMCLMVNVKVQCYKEQYCRGAWNIRSTNQGKLDKVKQEMARRKSPSEESVN